MIDYTKPNPFSKQLTKIPANLDTFATRLRQELHRRKFKVTRFAVECGVSTSQMSQYLNGKRTPAMFTLQRMLYNLPDIDIRWLVMGDNYEEPA